ncbi:hypothetical protein LBMAG53_21810 [Planctomycetota bacterium]|nr:hypothetical protein LBMAG53_21810 [Planctomycetota bacterium]
MGYDIHITRKDEWSEDGNDIPLNTWINYCSIDGEMTIVNTAEVDLENKEKLSYSNNGLAIWNKYSKNTDQNKAWFDYQSGNIVVKNPDQEIIDKMIRISKALGAKVQGDDGECYGDPTNNKFTIIKNKPWWKIW